jgi:hypothetical protein
MSASIDLSRLSCMFGEERLLSQLTFKKSGESISGLIVDFTLLPHQKRKIISKTSLYDIQVNSTEVSGQMGSPNGAHAEFKFKAHQSSPQGKWEFSYMDQDNNPATAEFQCTYRKR